MVGAAAEWSKALLLRVNINESQEIPGSLPGLSKKGGPYRKLKIVFNIYVSL